MVVDARGTLEFFFLSVMLQGKRRHGKEKGHWWGLGTANVTCFSVSAFGFGEK